MGYGNMSKVYLPATFFNKSVRDNNDTGDVQIGMVKLGSKSVLLDSGNTSRSLMSLDCAEHFKFKLNKTGCHAVGVDNRPVVILGEVKDVQFTFDSLPQRIFTEDFLVIKSMNVDVNLGLKFLEKNECRVFFTKTAQNKLILGNDVINLTIKKKPFTQDIISACNEVRSGVKKVTVDMPGIQENRFIPVSDVMHERCKIMTSSRVIIPPRTVMAVKVNSSLARRGGNGYISPDPRCFPAKKYKDLLVMEGVVPVNKSGFLVNVVNMGVEPVTIPTNCKIGHLSTLANIINSCEDNKTDKGISGSELLQRVNFIKEKFKMELNPLLSNDKVLKAKVIKLLIENFDCVSTSTADIGRTNLISFDMELLPGAEPFKARPIRLNPSYEDQLKKQIETWLEMGVIEAGSSPWSSPIFAVRKKTANEGEVNLRFVLDFRMLNSLTVKNNFPLPNITANLERLGGGRYFTTLDLTAAYHSVPMTDRAAKYSAFCTAEKQYLFRRLPFGLAAAPAVFCELMQKVLDLYPIIRQFCLAYLDDLILFSKTIEDHLGHLEAVLKVLVLAGLKLNLGKCDIIKTQVKYLGHVINREGIFMDRSYLDKIKAWPKPVSGKDIQSYLGYLNYYNSYFQDFAKITQPLNKLRGDKFIVWDQVLTQCFENTKAMFVKEVSKGYPDWEGSPFILDTDFSSTAMGAVLSQVQNNREVMLQCRSRVCGKHEQNYASFKGELAALVYACRKFEHYLRHSKFIVRTDNTALVNYRTWAKQGQGITVRWICYIQSFHFDIEYRKGTLHCNADILSRTIFDKVEVSSDHCELNSQDPIEDQIYVTECSRDRDQLRDLGFRLSSTIWSKETQKDPVLRLVIEFLLKNVPPNSNETISMPYRAKQIIKVWDHLFYKNGLVIFKQPLGGNKHVFRVVVPISMYEKVFQFAHSGRISGHKGVSETVLKINSKFYMPYALKYVTFQVRNCIKCLNKRKGQRANIKIEHSPYGGEPLSEIFIDTIGPLTLAAYKGTEYRHILIMVDSFSRFLFTYPLVDIKAETIIDCILVNFVPIHGLFDNLRSDRGSSFTAHIFSTIMKELGVENFFIPVRSARSNPSERYNQNLYSYFKTDVRFQTKDWPAKLTYATFCCNVAYNSRIGATPFFRFHGRDPKIPINVLDPLKNNKVKSPSFEQFIYRMEKGWQVLKANTAKYITVKNAYRVRKPLGLNVICFVFFDIVRVGLSKKLQSFYLGPFVITRVFSASLYEVTPLPNCPIKSKKPLVSPRDKLYVLDSVLELTKDEFVGVASLDLEPSQYISADSHINVAKVQFDLLQDQLVERSGLLEGTEKGFPVDTTSLNSSTGNCGLKIREDYHENHFDNKSELSQVLRDDVNSNYSKGQVSSKLSSIQVDVTGSSSSVSTLNSSVSILEDNVFNDNNEENSEVIVGEQETDIQGETESLINTPINRDEGAKSRKTRRPKASFQDMFSYLIIPHRLRSEAQTSKKSKK